MTIVYDPLTYRTVVARPGEIPYKFWSVNKHVIDAAAAGICTLQSSDTEPGDTTKLWLDLTLPENAVGAVKAYDGATWVALTPALFYSHIAGGESGFVTDLEMETYIGGLIGVSLQAWGDNLDQWSLLDPTTKEDAGVAATLDAAHLAAGDPHPQYLTAAEGAAAYQPLDSDLTAIAALTTAAYGRAFLALADAAAGRTALALGTLATQSGTFSGTSSGTNTGDQTITLTGDVTGTGTGSFATTLATVNANVGSFGLAGSVAQFTVNAKGLITAAVNVAISIASTAISDATAAGRSMLTAANAAAQTALLSAFVGDSGAGGTKGLVPAPIAGDSAKFLRGDGAFASIPGGGDLLAANNLSDLANAATARTNLGLAIGTNVQAYDADLTTWAGVTPGTNVATRLAIANGIREVLTAARTYYVRTDGSDSNTGLADTAGGAFLTVQKAVDILATLDQQGYTVTISVRGSFNGGCTIASTPTGPIAFAGSSGTPANDIIGVTASIGVAITCPCSVTFGNCTFRGSYGDVFTNNGGAFATIGAGAIFGGTGYGIFNQNGIWSINQNFTISGAKAAWLTNSGKIEMASNTITFAASTSFSSAGVVFNGGLITMYLVTLSAGSAPTPTGVRYAGTQYAVLGSYGAGSASTYFPGNSNGTLSNALQT